MVAGVLIGVGINQYMYDKDLDGVSNDKDDFPSDPDEWKDKGLKNVKNGQVSLFFTYTTQ